MLLLRMEHDQLVKLRMQESNLLSHEIIIASNDFHGKLAIYRRDV